MEHNFYKLYRKGDLVRTFSEVNAVVCYEFVGPYQVVVINERIDNPHSYEITGYTHVKDMFIPNTRSHHVR
jgi:hypothetical protein